MYTATMLRDQKQWTNAPSHQTYATAIENVYQHLSYIEHIYLYLKTLSLLTLIH